MLDEEDDISATTHTGFDVQDPGFVDDAASVQSLFDNWTSSRNILEFESSSGKEAYGSVQQTQDPGFSDDTVCSLQKFIFEFDSSSDEEDDVSTITHTGFYVQDPAVFVDDTASVQGVFNTSRNNILDMIESSSGKENDGSVQTQDPGFSDATVCSL